MLQCKGVVFTEHCVAEPLPWQTMKLCRPFQIPEELLPHRFPPKERSIWIFKEAFKHGYPPPMHRRLRIFRSFAN